MKRIKGVDDEHAESAAGLPLRPTGSLPEKDGDDSKRGKRRLNRTAKKRSRRPA